MSALDTITDEQIRELREQAAMTTGAERISNPKALVIRDACWALGQSCWFAGIDCRIPHGLDGAYGREARARCAEILAARTVAK